MNTNEWYPMDSLSPHEVSAMIDTRTDSLWEVHDTASDRYMVADRAMLDEMLLDDGADHFGDHERMLALEEGESGETGGGAAPLFYYLRIQ